MKITLTKADLIESDKNFESITLFDFNISLSLIEQAEVVVYDDGVSKQILKAEKLHFRTFLNEATLNMFKMYGTLISFNNEEWSNLPFWYKKEEGGLVSVYNYHELPDHVMEALSNDKNNIRFSEADLRLAYTQGHLRGKRNEPSGLEQYISFALKSKEQYYIKS